MELKLQQFESPEESPDEVSILEEEVTSISQCRAIWKKDISSSYSNLILKTKEKTSVPRESTIQKQSTNKSQIQV